MTPITNLFHPKYTCGTYAERTLRQFSNGKMPKRKKKKKERNISNRISINTTLMISKKMDQLVFIFNS